MDVLASEHNICVEESRDRIMLALSDRIGIDDAIRLHDAAQRVLSSEKPVIIDATRAEHLDASAMQILLVLLTELETSLRETQFTGLSTSMQEYARTAGLSNFLAGAE